MAEQAQKSAPPSESELQGVIKEMIAQGKTRDQIDAVITKYQEQNPKDYWRDAAVGTLIGLGLSVPHTVKAILWDLPVGVLKDTVSMFEGGSPENAKKFLDGLTSLPAEWKDAGPEKRGEIVGDMLGTIAMSGAVGAEARPIARTGGKVLTELGGTGRYGGLVRAGGMYPLISGALQGNIPRMLEGAGIVLAPSVMRKGGEMLTRFGENDAAFLAKKAAAEDAAKVAVRLPNGARTLDFGDMSTSSPVQSTPRTRTPEPQGVPIVGTPAEASGRVQKVVAKEGKEAANAERLATIEGRREGMEPGQPSFSTSMSATTPEGGTARMSQSFKVPEKASAEGVPPEYKDDYDKLVKSLGGGEGAKTTADAWLQQQLKLKATPPAAAMAGTPIRVSRTPAEATRNLTPPTPEMSPNEAMRAETEKAVRTEKVPISQVPASKSKGEMSATPGLTRNDVEALGLNPDNPITSITPEMQEKIVKARKARQDMYRSINSDAARSNMEKHLMNIQLPPDIDKEP